MIYDITDVDLIVLLRGIYNRVSERHGLKEELDLMQAIDLSKKIKNEEFIDYHNGIRMKIDCIWKKNRLLFYSEDWLDDDTNKDSYHNVMISILGPEKVIRVSEYDVMSNEEAEEIINNRIWRVTNGSKSPGQN